MKWFAIICVFAFFAGWCLTTETEAARHRQHYLSNEIKPQEDDEEENDGVTMEEFYIEKYVKSNEEYYHVQFDIDGLPLEKAKKVKLTAPNGKKTEFKIKDKNGFNSLCSEADDLYVSYEDFQKAFPEGKYTFTFTPEEYGSLKVYMEHDFPSTPVIISPKDGDTVSASGFTITWEDMEDDLESLILHIDDDAVFFMDVPVTDTTSFNVPDGLLKPDTEYRIELRAQKRANVSNDYDENCSIRTVRRIDFFTESE